MPATTPKCLPSCSFCRFAFWSIHRSFCTRILGFGRWIAAVAFVVRPRFISHNSDGNRCRGLMLGALYWLMLAAGYRSLGGTRCAREPRLPLRLPSFLSAGFWLPALGRSAASCRYSNVTTGELGRTTANLFLHWWKLTSAFSLPILDSRAGNPLDAAQHSFGAASWLALIAGLLSLPFCQERGKTRSAWCHWQRTLSHWPCLQCLLPSLNLIWQALLSALSACSNIPAVFCYIATYWRPPRRRPP